MLQNVRRKTVVSILAVAATLGAASAGGAWAQSRSDGPVSYVGKSAETIANAIGCEGYAQQKRGAESVDFYDQGSCTLGEFTVKVTTFNDAGEQRAFAILMNTLIPKYTHRGGSYAEGNGWNVADDINLSKALAVRVSAQLSGSVREFSATSSSAQS